METSGLNKKSHLVTRWLFLFGLMVVTFTSAGAQDYNPSSVRISFDYLKKAIRERDGKEALKWVDRQTLGYYEHILKEAQTLDSAALIREPLYDGVFVLAIRMQAILMGTARMKEKPFFVFAVDSGLLMKTGLPLGKCAIGDVSFIKDSAIGRLTLNAAPVPYYTVGFKYHEGQWKVDLASLISALSRMNGPPNDVYMTASVNNGFLEALLSFDLDQADKYIWQRLVIQ